MKPQKIVIIGADPDLYRTIHMCLSAYLIPVGVHYLAEDSLPPSELAVNIKELCGPARHDQGYLASLPRSVPPLDEAAFCQVASDWDVEVLSGAYGLRERDHFMRIMMYCKNKMKLGRPIRHPAFMLDRISVNCKGYVCAGYPGSGNMLVQNVLDSVVRLAAPTAADPLREVLKTYASMHWSSLTGYIEHHFYNAGFWRSQTFPTHQKFGGISVDLAHEDRPIMMSGLPVNAHFWANPWTGSHEPPTRAALDYFDRYGFRFIFIARNPLDIIVSVAGKFTSYAGHRAAAWLIDNRLWFEDTLRNVVYYYRQACENRQRLILARYENFLTSPVDAIVEFAGALTVPLEQKAAVSLAARLAGAQLSADPGHYWQPGEGKWRNYIPREYGRMIEDSGVVALAAEFGYSVDTSQLSRRQGELDSEGWPNTAILALEETRWFACAGKPHSLFSPEITVMAGCNVVAATYKRYERVLGELFESAVFGWLLHAAGDLGTDNFIAPLAAREGDQFDGFRHMVSA